MGCGDAAFSVMGGGSGLGDAICRRLSRGGRPVGVLDVDGDAAERLLSRLASKPMREQGKGAIVNISSGASMLAQPQAAPYGAAKAGVNNLTGAMAAAWTPQGGCT
jgi:NAD(P)-dependent dehydrogenase (short-subunit alcohol dehydrogenase family)